MKLLRKIQRKATLSLALILATAGCAHTPKNISGQAVTTLTPYTTRAGFIPNKKMNQQNFISVGNGNVSVYAWSNQEPREVDVGFRIHGELSEKVSVRAGADIWKYPGEKNPLGKKDIALEAGVHYSAPLGIEADTTWTHTLKDNDTPHGDLFYGAISRPISLGKTGEVEYTLTPSIGGAYLDNFFGVTGPSQITPGISLTLNRKNWFVDGFLKNQFGNSGIGIDDFAYCGLSVGYKFKGKKVK